MKLGISKWIPTVIFAALATALVPGADAQCGRHTTSVKPMVWQPGVAGARTQLAALVSGQRDVPEIPSIVGMWHVIFTARTSNGAAIPNTVIDNALVVWHGDGTEIMNSGRPPQDGNFCLGVWEQTGRFSYRLNHFAWGANAYTPGTPDGVVGTPIGQVHYTEDVTVDPEGKHYSGSFTLTEYDSSGHVLAAFTGEIKATRITVNTSPGDLL